MFVITLLKNYADMQIINNDPDDDFVVFLFREQMHVVWLHALFQDRMFPLILSVPNNG